MNKFSVLMVLLGSYAHGAQLPLYEEITDHQPAIGIKTEVYLGDRMLVQRTGSYRECVITKENHEKVGRQYSYFFRANEPICKRKANSRFFTPTYVNETRGNGRAEVYSPVTYSESRSGKVKLCIKGSMWCIKDLGQDDLEHSEATFVYKEDSFQQTIEYAGRSGDVLKFMYSEYTDRSARDSFNREFQIDLNDGNVAAYKGALIEIHKATNTQITYSVVRNFRE